MTSYYSIANFLVVMYLQEVIDDIIYQAFSMTLERDAQVWYHNFLSIDWGIRLA